MKDPSLLLAKQFKCGIRLGALEEKEARNISTSSFHLQDRGFCASYPSPCHHQRRQCPTDTSSGGLRPESNETSEYASTLLPLVGFRVGASTLHSTVHNGCYPHGFSPSAAE